MSRRNLPTSPDWSRAPANRSPDVWMRCRASEIGLLEIRDFQPRTERLMVTRLKGSNSGEHSLNRKESKALKAWLKVRGMLPGAIFPSRKGGPINRKTLDDLIKAYGERAGWPVKMRHCHIFKHACCTHLLSRGFNVERS